MQCNNLILWNVMNKESRWKGALSPKWLREPQHTSTQNDPPYITRHEIEPQKPPGANHISHNSPTHIANSPSPLSHQKTSCVCITPQNVTPTHSFSSCQGVKTINTNFKESFTKQNKSNTAIQLTNSPAL